MQPSPKNYLPGGSDRFYYEDLKNNFADNLMSPKRESSLFFILVNIYPSFNIKI